MNKICTTIEQSKKLLELGIDVNTADMFYAELLVDGIHKYNLHPLESYGFKTFEEAKLKASNHLSFIPSWSLSGLLKLMPIVNESTYKMCGTLDGGAIVSHDELTCVMYQEDNPIDAAFEMVCWLKENEKI